MTQPAGLKDKGMHSMRLIYYAHSYRPIDAQVVEFFAGLMRSEGFTPSLDPPSDQLNSAKPERHLRSTDGLIVVPVHSL
jgi:hypothetical protein